MVVYKRNSGDSWKMLVFLILTMLCILLFAIMTSCKTRYIVQDPVIVHERDSIVKVNTLQVHDTLMMRDSVYHYVKGDTTIIERWHHLQAVNHIARVDTVVQVQEKEIPVPYPVVQEVQKPFKWYHSALMWLGGIALLMGGGWLFWRLKFK